MRSSCSRRSSTCRTSTPSSLRSAGMQTLRASAIAKANAWLAKVESPKIEDAVAAIGAPQSAVGVVIALLVLLPETLAAYRNASRGRVQIGLNLTVVGSKELPQEGNAPEPPLRPATDEVA